MVVSVSSPSTHVINKTVFVSALGRNASEPTLRGAFLLLLKLEKVDVFN